MSDEAAFIRGICANPDDDTVRLVYADWLEENGQGERAEFIRVQIRIEREPSFAAPEVCPLRCRERELLYASPAPGEANGLNWLPDPIFAALAREDWVIFPDGDRFAWRRGFVCEIHLTTAAFIEDAAVIFARNPITSVRLDDKSPLDNEYGAPADRWFWIRAMPDEDPRTLIRWEIPFVLWDHPPHPQDFDSEDAAIDWLSRRCVDYGREKAGLPAWAPRQEATT